MPKESILANVPYSKAIYASDGRLLRLTLAEDGIFRLFTPLDEISSHIIESTLFYEDRFFYLHPGFNPMALFRGFITTYIKKQRMMGGSTVTMQLARTRYGIISTSISGKIKQIFYAVWLEAAYSKKEILEAYLNIAPYGHNIEGVGTASLVYYQKRSQNLSLVESLTLTVIPQNPVKRLPTTATGWAELKPARDNLMNSWMQSHANDQDKLVHFDMPLKIHKINELPFRAPHFTDGILKQWVASADTNEYFSTLNLDFQSILELKINEFVDQRNHLGVKNAAGMLINTKTMELMALVGSVDFFSDEIFGQVDGTNAMRSPGSVLKPFIYSMAIDKGIIHPLTMLKDAPKKYGAYSPENADRGYLGPIFAMDSLNHSRNIPAVDLLINVGMDDYLKILEQTGVKSLKDSNYYGSALALGGFEVTMRDIATIYATYNNGGELFDIVTQQEILPISRGSIMSAEAAFITKDMMQHNKIPAIGGYAPRFHFPIAWKTGTSFQFRDGWTAAVFGDYVLVTWVGNFDSEGNAAFLGRISAAHLAFMTISALSGNLNIPTSTFAQKNEDIPYDLNVKFVDICAVNGELPTDFCPVLKPSLFIPGVSPIKTSELFQQIPIDKSTGLRACYYDMATTYLDVYEFWSYDILELFAQAGLRKKVPPPYMPDCTVEDTQYRGLPPEISYPQSGVVYDLSMSPMGNDELPLTAASSGDATLIYWFVDNSFVGTSGNGKSFFWKSTIGRHQLLAVDNLGRSSSLEFETN